MHILDPTYMMRARVTVSSLISCFTWDVVLIHHAHEINARPCFTAHIWKVAATSTRRWGLVWTESLPSCPIYSAWTGSRDGIYLNCSCQVIVSSSKRLKRKFLQGVPWVYFDEIYGWEMREEWKRSEERDRWLWKRSESELRGRETGIEAQEKPAGWWPEMTSMRSWLSGRLGI